MMLFNALKYRLAGQIFADLWVVRQVKQSFVDLIGQARIALLRFKEQTRNHSFLS